MSFEVRLRRAAQKGLDALPERDYEMVAEAIGTLEEKSQPTERQEIG